MAKPLLDRLMSKAHAIPFSGCLIWTGDCDKDGYGVISNQGKRIATHRAAYALFKGPPEKFVCHTCDVPACINPDHLYDGTNSDNMRDRSRRGRANLAKGERHGRSRFTQADVQTMRDMRSSGKTLCQIAKIFDVKSLGHISDIVNFRKWKA